MAQHNAWFKHGARKKMLEAFDGSAVEAFRAAEKTKYRNSNFLMMNVARICITTRHKDT